MASIELYIDNQLCETENPENFSIYLKRQFLNPAELSTKDAQKSYDITLPATATNNVIFGYTNVEEVKGKFARLYDAQLLVNGIRIFDGKFKLSEITRTSYKGNLGVPAPKTVKDIFGEMMMNKAGKWLIDYVDESDAEKYNTGTYDKSKYGEIAPCIFPLVFYGLLPRYDEGGNYPERNVYDDSVMLNMNDIPPSVNCLQMLKQIFRNAGHELTGTAMNDERLKNLYVSYRNQKEFEMPWSVNFMKISGKWNNYENYQIDSSRYFHEGSADEKRMDTISVNLFDCRNISNLKIEDAGSNIKIEGYNQPTPFKSNVKTSLVVPRSGYYKLAFSAGVQMETSTYNGLFSKIWISSGSFNKKYELKLVRNYNEDDFGNEKFDNTFYNDNQDQSEDSPNSIFPLPNQVNFIDTKQNPNFICGFSWGGDPSSDYMKTYINPLESTIGVRSNTMAISGWESWSYRYPEGTKYRAYSAIDNPGYVDKDRVDANKYKVRIQNSQGYSSFAFGSNGYGHLEQIIWLDQNDTLSLVDISEIETRGSTHIWPHHSVDFNLELTPFQQSKSWMDIGDDGYNNKIKTMNWNDSPTLLSESIDLIKFLPAEVKINDWVDNFCKAFNLNIVSTENGFDLNLKNNTLISDYTNIIDLDQYADIAKSSNATLKLPYMYELGFTINTSEEGYYDSIDEYVKDDEGKNTEEKLLTAGDNGGGKYYTGSNETNTITQTSSFSYNWFKKLIDTAGNTITDIPVISEHEIWDKATFYQDALNKQYFSLPQRFWFHSGTIPVKVNGKENIALATVSDVYENNAQKLILDYKDKPDSITKNFFLLFTDNNNHYKMVDCILNPEDYNRLNKALVKFNGDLYSVAEMDGYDPQCRKNARLKLIRTIL